MYPTDFLALMGAFSIGVFLWGLIRFADHVGAQPPRQALKIAGYFIMMAVGLIGMLWMMFFDITGL